MTYESADGRRVDLSTGTGRPRLIILWASWCQPCMSELNELVQQQIKITELGIDVLALSVDGLGEDGSQADVADQALQAMKFPFAQGRATAELLDALQAFHDDLFMARRPLPLPSSFLLDAAGRLAVVYRGPVSLTRLSSDFEKLELPDGDLLAASLRRPGRWLSVPLVSSTELTLERGRELFQRRSFPEALAAFSTVLKQEPDNALAHFFSGVIQTRTGELAAAYEHLEQAVLHAPDLAAARLQLADLALRQGNSAVAEQHDRAAIDLGANADAHGKLAVILAMRKDLAAAETHFRLALQIEPDSTNNLANLGKVLLDQGKLAEALTYLQPAAEAGSRAAQLNLVWILSTAPRIVSPRWSSGRTARY